MLRINNIKMPIKHTEDSIKGVVANFLGIKISDFISFEITGQSIDARNKNNVFYVYSVDIELKNEEKFKNLKNVRSIEKQKYETEKITNYNGKRPVVVGSGPAGIYAALILAESGLKPIILEQGKQVEERQKDVYKFFKDGKLLSNSNVQFGEGGAGTFSDGKLNTNTSNFRMQKVFNELIEAGADKKIAYMSKPHVGTDKLIGILKNIRKKIESLGGEYRFENKFKSFNYVENNGIKKIKSILVENLKNDSENSNQLYEIETDCVIIAIGHSARDTFYMLNEKNVYMEKKVFSVGVRIEHKQEMINNSQYGKFANKLPAAEYKLNAVSSNKRGVYTFCMCPGGVVVPATSEENSVVVNGMSFSSRNLENANSAILVNVFPEDFEGDNVLAGVEFQRELEKKAFILGGSNYNVPIQLFGDFVKGEVSKKLGDVKPSYYRGYKFADLNKLFPEYISRSLKEGIRDMGKKIKGFDRYDSVLSGVESRSSSPVKIVRNERFFSNIEGMIPCGEGAGYAGGIVSAAVDGIKCGEQTIRYIKEMIDK